MVMLAICCCSPIRKGLSLRLYHFVTSPFWAIRPVPSARVRCPNMTVVRVFRKNLKETNLRRSWALVRGNALFQTFFGYINLQFTIF
jgi:hypothetical protein